MGMAVWANLDSPRAVGTALVTSLFAVVTAYLVVSIHRHVNAADQINRCARAVQQLVMLDVWDRELEARGVPRPLSIASVLTPVRRHLAVPSMPMGMRLAAAGVSAGRDHVFRRRRGNIRRGKAADARLGQVVLDGQRHAVRSRFSRVGNIGWTSAFRRCGLAVGAAGSGPYP